MSTTSTTQKLADKVAIVTGASKGIGASIARHLAAEGAAVVVNYSSSKEDADLVVSGIETAGGRAIAVKANLSEQAEIETLIAKTVKAYGRIDILVNNAGIYEFAPLGEITAGHFHKQFNLNVLGLLLTTQEALGHFPEEGGSIINISSVVSTFTPPGGSVYSATKASVDAITRTLSKELGSRRIRVNSINPGMVETEGTHTAGFLEGDLRHEFEKTSPLGRIGQPHDIATIAVFLATSDSSWITGEHFVVAGGLR